MPGFSAWIDLPIALATFVAGAAVEVGLRKHNIPHVGVKLRAGSSFKPTKNVLDRIFRKIGAEDYDYLITTDVLNMRWDEIVQRVNEMLVAHSSPVRD